MTETPPTLDELERHLKKCADYIRNGVDRTDYKEYILPLVFYKSISDTYEDEYEEALDEVQDDELAKDRAFHEFVVPDEVRWEELRNQSKNISQFINDAFGRLEKANRGKLENVFRADFAGEEGLSDQKLKPLIEHLSTYNLSIERVPPDMLGEAYMYLVRHFAEEEGRDGGEFFTPPRIVRLMVRLMAPFSEGDRFHDPTCGSGGMLIQAADFFRDEQGGEPGTLRLTGQEINPDIAAIAKMNLFLHGYDGDVYREDSLASPQFTENGSLEGFDFVLANFPFSYDWPKNDLKDDKYGRFDWAEKLPRADRGDYAFIMHMVAHLNESGQMAVVIPHGVLFRKHERKFREPLLEADIAEAVIGLPENLFQNNSIPAAILVINKDKPSEREGQVQFIHAAEEAFYRELSNQNELTDEGIDHVVENFHAWTTEERVSRTVDLEEIRENDYNLNIALYVDTTEPEEEIDVEEELAKLRDLQGERAELEQRMDKHLEALGYE